MATRRPVGGRISPGLAQDAAERVKRAPKDRPKRLVVHLGNVEDSGQLHGHKVAGRKTKRYAERFPNVEFVGIDTKPMFGRTPKNLTQYIASFEEGLERLADGSADIISSEFALGHYGNMRIRSRDYKGHTRRTLKIAFHKLKKGGKIHIAVGEGYRDLVIEALEEAGFSKEKIKDRPLGESDRKRTYWTAGMHFGIQISAEK